MKILIDNACILTMDEKRTVIKNGWILTAGDRILEVGEGRPTEPFGSAPDVLHIDGEGGIVMPGMVNTHCHVPMVPFRSMGDDCPDRLRRFLFPLELAAMTPRLVYLSAKYGICEMLLSGVTAFLDMYYFEDEVAKACEELGIRGFLGETVINMATCDSPSPYGGLKLGEEFLSRWKGHELVTPIVAPHGTNTNDSKALRAAHAQAREHNTLFTLHASEMDYEMTYFRETYHETPTEFLYREGLLDDHTIAAHCIHMTDRDLELFRETGAGVSHCIGSNTKAGKGVARVKDMLEQGIPVGLGTDGPSSGNTLGMFPQFRLFASFQKTHYKDRSLFPAEDIVALGTVEGAKLLKMSDTGMLKPGQKADIVLVETKSVNMFPIFNPYSALVYSADSSNVDTVIVNGKLLVREKQLVNADLRQIRGELEVEMGPFREAAAKYSDMI